MPAPPTITIDRSKAEEAGFAAAANDDSQARESLIPPPSYVTALDGGKPRMSVDEKSISPSSKQDSVRARPSFGSRRSSWSWRSLSSVREGETEEQRRERKRREAEFWSLRNGYYWSFMGNSLGR